MRNTEGETQGELGCSPVSGLLARRREEERNLMGGVGLLRQFDRLRWGLNSEVDCSSKEDELKLARVLGTVRSKNHKAARNREPTVGVTNPIRH